MRKVITSGFFLRFAGGFALGTLALIGMQPAAVQANFAGLIGTATHHADA